jgi:hypothetical protein
MVAGRRCVYSIHYIQGFTCPGAKRPSKKNTQGRLGKDFPVKTENERALGRQVLSAEVDLDTFTLLDLKMLGLPQNIKDVQSIIRKIISEEKSEDGGINPSQSISASDVCVNGMFLQYACYFKSPAKGLESVIDFLLKEQMPDGGFNCRSNRSGARHSSMHSTVSVMEGLSEYHSQGYSYKLESVRRMIRDCADFLLLHRLFRSDRTGKVIHPDFLKLSYPPGWKYNILRALDAFRHAKIEWHPNMQDAVDVILAKKNSDETWNTQARIPGKTHTEMEKAGQPGRWNTLMVYRTLGYYRIQID